VLYSKIIGQQLIQLPDGKLHVTNYINQISSPQTIKITRTSMVANNNNITKTGSQVSSKYFFNLFRGNLVV